MEYLLKASTITAIFYLCYKLFLQNDTFFQFNRIFFLIGILATFLIPLIVISVYIEYTPTNITIYDTIVDASKTPIITEIVKEPFKFLDYLSTIYIIGIVGFSIHFCIQLLSLSKIITQNTRQKEADFIIINSTKNILPFSFFKWVVYNPNQFNKEELKQVLDHEKAHVKQYHSIDTILAQLSCIVLWFNPFVWFYSKNLRQNLEFIADENAQKNTTCKKSYQYTLLKTSLAKQQLIITNNFFNSQIKKRIIMLQKSKSKKINQLKYLLILPLITIILINCSKKVIKSNINTVETIENPVNSDELIAKKKQSLPFLYSPSGDIKIDKNFLFIVDEKEISHFEMRFIKLKNIKSAKVLKEEKDLEKYNAKEKKGVVLITTQGEITPVTLKGYKIN